MLEAAIANNVLTQALNAVWLYVFAFNPRFSKRVTAAVCIAVGVVMEAVALAVFYRPDGITAEGGALSYLFSIALMTCAYTFVLQRGPKLQSLLIMACYICFWLLAYLAVILAFDARLGDGNPAVFAARIALNAAAIALFVRFAVPALRRAPIQGDLAYGAFLGIALIAAGLLTVLLYYRVFQESAAGFVLAVTLAMLALVALTAFLIARFNRALCQKAELERVELQNKLLGEAVVDYEAAAEEARLARHDARHHNLAILGMAKRGDVNAIVEYLREYDLSEEGDGEPRYCANNAANSVIAAFARRARQAGVRMEATADIDSALPMAGIDIVALLANMLENALNACAALPEGVGREITLTTARKGRKLAISCENTCDGGVRVVDGMPARPGVGTSSIRHVVERYGGDVLFSVHEGRFTCTVLLDVVPHPQDPA